MLPFFRWQWLWRSRRRLFTCGLAVFLLGVALLALLLATWLWGRPNANIARGIPAPVILMAVGGYMMLQAAFSGAGAFGDHDFDDSREGRRRAWRRQRAAKPSDDRPLPLAPDTADEEPVRMARCPACGKSVGLPPARPRGEMTECPNCGEWFDPD